MSSIFENISTNISIELTTTITLSNTLRFWLFLFSDIFAFICTILVLYQLLSHKQSRQALHNHATILMLCLAFIYEVFDIPLHLHFFHTAIIYPASPILCLIWIYVDYCFYFLIVLLLVLVSIQRHIFIFHNQLMATRAKRWMLHYGPLTVVTLFMLIYYGILIFAPICETKFDFSVDLCGMLPCYSSITSFMMIERIAFSTMPCFLIIIFNLSLLIRVIWQKYRIHRAAQWRKQRKLAIQVFLMSSLYIVFGFPLTIIYLVRMTSDPTWANQTLSIHFFLTYYVIFLLPFVCLASLPRFEIGRNQVHTQTATLH